MTIMASPSASADAEGKAHYAIGEGPATVISVSLPRGTVDALRERVGKRGLSAAVSAAMEKQLRDEAFDLFIAEHVKEHGAFTEEERKRSSAILARAAEREAAWRAAHPQ